MTTTTEAPAIRLLPPKDARDYCYFRERLADPSLLDRSVAVGLYGALLLAVPVGGTRRGGFLPVDEILPALAISRLLADRPGFPNPRVRWSPWPDTCHAVRWGDEPPPEDDIARGWFYGYSATAITAFLQWAERPLQPLRHTASP